MSKYAMLKMVPPTGFEPVTSSLPMTRSTAGAMAAHNYNLT
tara:strand:+ start:252 stop:374 length:123 start_codon:yes stop_codon:yes gene_type:complete